MKTIDQRIDWRRILYRVIVPGARWRFASRRSTSFATRNEARIAISAIPIRTQSSCVVARRPRRRC